MKRFKYLTMQLFLYLQKYRKENTQLQNYYLDEEDNIYVLK